MISTGKLLSLGQFQTGLQASKEYIDGKVTDVAEKIKTLNGEDEGKSVRTIANEELSAQLIPENAKEALDTLAEIAAWIQSHPDDAASINAAITALQTKLSGFADDEIDGVVKKYIDETTAAAGIKLTDISAVTAGTGNAITAASYNNITGKFEFTKGATYLKESDIEINVATDAEVTAACQEIFG